MILVIDDELLNRFTVASILKRHGYQVIEAADGLKGLELISKWRFDLVITNLRTPKLDGADLAVQIHANWPETALILTSGYFSAKAQKVLAAGLADFIYKPIERDQLIAKVQSAVLRSTVQQIHSPSRDTTQANNVASALSASRKQTRSYDFKSVKT
jgi:DNA-binding response OmpR family regulator